MAQGKTNAMRILDMKKIPYIIHEYESTDGKIDGVSVAHKVQRDPKEVYKTLVATGNNKEIFVFIIPVEAELDLKKASKVAGVKKIEMIAVKDIQKITGYVRGGCSPIGMKKTYPTIINESINGIKNILVSGGKIGVQIELNTNNLILLTDAIVVDVAKV